MSKNNPLYLKSLYWLPVCFLLASTVLSSYCLLVDPGIVFLGVKPLSEDGLQGIFFMPLIHGSWQHFISNVCSLLPLFLFVFYFFRRVAQIIFWGSWFIPGIFVWFVGRDSYHIGASGMIFSFAYFSLIWAILNRNINYASIALVVILLFNGIFIGIFPGSQAGVSWEGHLGGAISGFMLALVFKNYDIARDSSTLPEEKADSNVSVTAEGIDIVYDFTPSKKKEENQ